jgi:hypothetical protein
MREGNLERTVKNCLNPDNALQFERLKSESLVIADQHAAVKMSPESCTHRPSHTKKTTCTKLSSQRANTKTACAVLTLYEPINAGSLIGVKS